MKKSSDKYLKLFVNSYLYDSISDDVFISKIEGLCFGLPKNESLKVVRKKLVKFFNENFLDGDMFPEKSELISMIRSQLGYEVVCERDFNDGLVLEVFRGNRTVFSHSKDYNYALSQVKKEDVHSKNDTFQLFISKI